MMVMPVRVAVCVPVGVRPTYQFWASLRELKGAATSVMTNPIVLSVHGLPVDVARQQLTAQALADKAVTHLLFIDDDMQFPPDALERLLAHDKPIVGGLCHARRPPWNPMLAKRAGPLYGFEYDHPSTGLVEVDATGAAFLLVKREVFETMFASWWKPRGTLTEDFSFCVGAKEAGYSIFVDVGLDIGHVAEVVVDRKVARQLQSWRGQGEGAPLPAPSNWRAKASAFVGAAPRASIIIPTYNQKPELLKAAIASASAQSVPVEIIVVDDGSEPPVQVPPGVKLVRHERNQGISAALNSGITTMTTEWFCWLSSDDTLSPTKVDTQLTELLKVGAKAGFHDYDVPVSSLRGSRLPPQWRNLEEQHAQLVRGCCINGSTVMVHRSVFNDVGMFDLAFKFGQDWEMWCRIGEKYLWHATSQVLGSRHEGGNLTQLIAAECSASPRRKQRDDEDARIRARYAVRRCKHCNEPL